MSILFLLFFSSLIFCVAMDRDKQTIISHIAFSIFSFLTFLVCALSLVIEKDWLYVLPIVVSLVCLYVEMPYLTSFFSKWEWRKKGDF